jgi:hypothetical protein
MKTYLPRLLQIARVICKYIRRYEDKIKANIPEESWPALAAVLVACDALEVVLETAIPAEF